jgi:hypothetical protein
MNNAAAATVKILVKGRLPAPEYRPAELLHLCALDTQIYAGGLIGDCLSSHVLCALGRYPRELR